MELLDHTERLLKELKMLDAEIGEVTEYIENNKNDISFAEYESMVEKEFKLAMDISSIYQEIKHNLKKINKAEGMQFVVKRIQKEADSLVNAEIICL